MTQRTPDLRFTRASFGGEYAVRDAASPTPYIYIGTVRRMRSGLRGSGTTWIASRVDGSRIVGPLDRGHFPSRARAALALTEPTSTHRNS